MRALCAAEKRTSAAHQGRAEECGEDSSTVVEESSGDFVIRPQLIECRQEGNDGELAIGWGEVNVRLLHAAQSAFEGGDDADYGSAPERWGWFVVPLRMRGVKNYVIPIKSPAQAAGRLYRWWLGGGSSIQL